MCTGLELAALAASATGTGLSIKSQNDFANDQAKAAGDRARKADEFSQRAGARVSEEIGKLKRSNPAAEQQTAENGYMAALRRAAQESSGAAPVGAVSDRFAADNVASQAQIGAGNQKAARSIAAIDAPYLQRAREASSASRAASDLSTIGSAARGEDFLQQLRASLIQPNAATAAAGSFLTALGPAMASRSQPVKKPAVVAPRTVDSTIPGVF